MQRETRRAFLSGLLVASSGAMFRCSAAERAWPAEGVFGSLVCHADSELGSVHPVLQQLAELPGQIDRQIETGTKLGKVHLFLFARPATYRAYVQSHFPEAPERRALYVKRGAAGMIFAARSTTLGEDLRHEATHAYLHQVVTGLPLWLDEGLAEYYEVAAAERHFGHPHHREMCQRLRQGYEPSLSLLERLSPRQSLKSRDYCQSWAWVHFLLHGGADLQAELVQFLADLRADRPAGYLGHRLADGRGDLERRFRTHFIERMLSSD